MEVHPGMGAHGVGGSMKPGWVELEGLLRTIDKSSNRLDSLESIREVVKANGCLPDAPLRSRLIRAASSCASDPNSRIASKWLQVNRASPPPQKRPVRLCRRENTQRAGKAQRSGCRCTAEARSLGAGWWCSR